MQKLLLSEQIKKLDSPYDKLRAILGVADEQNMEQLKKEYKVKHNLCIVGVISAVSSMTKEGFDETAKSFPSRLFEALGFTKEQISRNHMCTELECDFVARLPAMLNHMMGFHQIKAKNLANLIPVLENDKRSIPTGIAKVVNKLKNSYKATD